MFRRALGLAAAFALHGISREVDRAVGVLLHTTLDLPGFVPEALSLLEPLPLLQSVAVWVAGGLALAAALAGLRARAERVPFTAAFDVEASGFTPVYLRPVLTTIALVSLAVRPTWPYGFTLPVALTQDWA